MSAQPQRSTVRLQRPEGEAAQHLSDALSLEREAADAVMRYRFDKADELRGKARASWAKFKEAVKG